MRLNAARQSEYNGNLAVQLNQQIQQTPSQPQQPQQSNPSTAFGRLSSY